MLCPQPAAVAPFVVGWIEDVGWLAAAPGQQIPIQPLRLGRSPAERRRAALCRRWFAPLAPDTLLRRVAAVAIGREHAGDYGALRLVDVVGG